MHGFSARNSSPRRSTAGLRQSGPLRWGLALVALAVLGAAAPAIPLAPAEAQTPRPRAARDLPALASEPAPEPDRRVPAGDYANPPGPSPLPAARPPSFDAARSVAIDEETTPTRLTYRNPDGSKTLMGSTRPVRYQDPLGAWRDLDLTVVAGPANTVVARSAPAAATLSGRGDATVATAAGPISLVHPGAGPGPAVLAGDTATYRGALEGRDLSLALRPDGFEETVVLADRAAPATYIDEFRLPAGVSARAAAATPETAPAVEFVDRAGDVVATFGRGSAHDAAFPGAGPGATTPVSITLLAPTPGQGAEVARVQVGVVDLL